MSAKVINFANFKGGVGKTTTTTILANILSQFGHNTLVIDFDPQGNASDMLMKTAGLGDEIPKSIFEGIQQQDITDCVMYIKQDLALIPSDFDLIGFPLFLNKTTKNDLMKRAYLLDYLIEPLRAKYDYIIIDTPPTISDYTNNAVVASDYVSIVMQTHPWSFRASKHFIPYLQEMIDEYDTNIHLLGIVPVMLKTDGKMDDYIMRLAQKEYKEHMFSSEIKHSERVKRYALSGITNDLIHDKRIKKMYGKLLSEVLERVEQHERRYIEQ